ncbi:MAG: toll/interleukin-1 receptor domain-containing protein [Flavobacteriaceae bacterium]
MEKSDTKLTDLRNLIFISYAYEDEVFAKWLARKLALYGYGVWIDQLKILGGESWVDDVDEAIKDRSYRVLAILSKDSLKKPNPKKERTLALKLENQRGLKDFIITLKLDHTDPDWTLSDISWIPFYNSWNEGLRKTLKKLRSLDAPKIHEGNPAIAKLSLESSSDLLIQESEPLHINWLPIKEIPEVLRVFNVRLLDKEELKNWPGFFLGEGRYGVLTNPHADLEKRVSKSKETHYWPSLNSIRGNPTGTVITKILNQYLRGWLKKAGCLYEPSQKVFYLPSIFNQESTYRFKDFTEKSSYIRTNGIIHIKKPVGPAETIVHHPAIRATVRNVNKHTFVIQIIPAVALFDQHRQPIKGMSVGPRRKKVTRMWNNGKWRKRLAAFTSILLKQANEDDSSPLKIDSVADIQSDWKLNEDALAETTTEESANNNDKELLEDELTVQITDDELEEWMA